MDGIETTLTGASVLAEVCPEAALRHAERQLAARHGVVRNARGEVQPGRARVNKLGGSELNFSSDTAWSWLTTSRAAVMALVRWMPKSGTRACASI